jgi:signal transduction histidine kinase
MERERLVKWSKEAKDFFEKAKDNSIVLDLVISYACASQTGEGFDELINTINSERIKRKIKKVNITDTSYLYRHVIPEFSKYADPTIPTEWFLRNKNAIEKLKVETELKSWTNGINTEKFKKWYQKIMIDFAGDEKGNNVNLEFRNEVKREASAYICKKGTILKHNLDFILEECAYTCTFFDNIIMAYPGKPTISVEMSMKTNDMKFIHLDYKISETSSKINKNLNDEIGLDILDKEISLFMREKVSNVNFFVIDKKGNPIYINDTLNKNIGKANTKQLSNEAWKETLCVIKECKEKIIEEKYNGKEFLSIKSPFIINGKVGGVIGLSVDITDRRKREELETELNMQRGLYKIAKEVAHDICSPLSALEIVRNLSLDKLPEKEREIFELSTRRIKDITNKLIEKYRYGVTENIESKEDGEKKEQEWIMPSSIKDIIESMKYRYQDREIKFRFIEKREKFAFIKGEYSDFNRMMTNLIKNGVEAIEGKRGEIDVRETVKEEVVEIRVKDNGKGIPQEMLEKIMRGEEIGTTKEEGHGIGMQQILGTIKALNGELKIESREGKGTEIILKFPKVLPPKWFVDKVELHKGDTVIILDDELLMHKVWKEKLKRVKEGNTINVECFTKGLEALKFLKSMGDKKRAFLLADYKLRCQDINGINVIDKSGMKERHILVTNMYLSDIKDFNEKSDYIKIFPKVLFNDFNLSIN